MGPFRSFIIIIVYLLFRGQQPLYEPSISFFADAYLVIHRPDHLVGHVRHISTTASRGGRSLQKRNCESRSPIDKRRVSSCVCFNAPGETLQHNDITWKLSPPPDAPVLRKLQWTVAGKLLKLQCQIEGVPPPRLIFPLGDQAVLEAYDRTTNAKLGRFGILTEAGPSTPELEQTVQELYNHGEYVVLVRAAAIIYMFVEPEHRGRGIGRLALETIAFLHAARGCGYTLLIADDKSQQQTQQTLVKWYERHGYERAPKLQDVLGSPDAVYGVSMIAPTATSVPEGCIVQWW